MTEPTAPLDPHHRWVIALGWRATVVLVVACAIGVVTPDLDAVPAAVGLVMFAIGSALMIGAFLRGLARSRAELVSVGGLFLLQDAVPRPVQRHLLGAFGVQCVASIVASSVRPFTPVAFTILAPGFGLGLAAWWSARHGRFPPRTPGQRR